MPADPPTPPGPAPVAEPVSRSLHVEELAANVERGFLGTHTQLSKSFGELFQLSARLNGLAELLVEKGLLQASEIQSAVEHAAANLQNSEFGGGLKFALLSGRPDKYQVAPTSVNCAERLVHCKSACCSLDVVLSPQDVEEGAVRWDLAQPYNLRRSADGYCCHLKRDTGHCEVYERRPYVCRAYSCAEDKRIWLDFEKMIPNEVALAALLDRRDRMTLIARNAGSPDGFRARAEPMVQGAATERAEPAEQAEPTEP